MSWEQGARVNGYNGGNVPAVDAIQFQSRYGLTGDNVFVDNVTVAAVPEPTAFALVAIGGAALLLRRRRRNA